MPPATQIRHPRDTSSGCWAEAAASIPRGLVEETRLGREAEIASGKRVFAESAQGPGPDEGPTARRGSNPHRPGSRGGGDPRLYPVARFEQTTGVRIECVGNLVDLRLIWDQRNPEIGTVR
jgi:hypothetical protein